VPPQYAHHTPYTSFDIQIVPGRGSVYQRGVPLSVPISTVRGVGFVEDLLSMGQVTLRVIRFSPLSIIPPTPHTHLYVHVSVTRRASGRSLRNFSPLSEIWKRCVGSCCNLWWGVQRDGNIQSFTVAIIVHQLKFLCRRCTAVSEWRNSGMCCG
jgi:hypothetical protein